MVGVVRKRDDADYDSEAMRGISEGMGREGWEGVGVSKRK